MNPLLSIKRSARRVVSMLATRGLPRQHEANPVLTAFKARAEQLARPRVLELGTKRSEPDRSTSHADWVPHASEFLGSDIEAGIDVDVVADVHRLTSVTGTEQFDVIISCSTFEHFKYPHLAAHEILKALRVGGLLFVQTHQTFPLHAYPYDYFRFSREAMAGLFGERMGFQVLENDYEYRSRIHSPHAEGVDHGMAFLNVCLFGEKTAPTPDDYIFEFDVP